MINQVGNDVERKVIAILQVLKDSRGPIGATLIARKLKDSGIVINERTIRNHLHFMDERGFTKLISRRRGRLVTQSGLSEIDNARIGDRVGSAITKIEKLIYQTSFEPEKGVGEVPINVTLLPADKFKKCLEIMKSTCTTHICSSELVCIAGESERLGEINIPQGKIGLATLSSVTVSAVIIKTGIPVDFKFGGLLQVRKNRYLRFVDLIEYTGSSINPYEVFIASKMTDVNGIYRDGNGKMLAGFNEIPALARPKVEFIINNLERLGISGLVTIGKSSEPLCETPVRSGKFGLVLNDGLNLVAAVAERGIEVENHAVCGTIDFTNMKPLSSF
jgi:repressor of nif and glnA expression